jgi:hyperosmotically inducible protein
MDMKNRNRVMTLGVLFSAFLTVSAGNCTASNPKRQPASLTDEIRHTLVMLPWYGVFDEIAFTMDGSGNVTLTGEVTRPVLKSDAETAVEHLNGVGKVINHIEVLPLSHFDDSIRVATYRAIFSRPGFEKYADQAVSPIRIIVENGNVILDGVIGSSFDKQVADMAARSVPGVFSVTDNLTIG